MDSCMFCHAELTEKQQKEWHNDRTVRCSACGIRYFICSECGVVTSLQDRFSSQSVSINNVCVPCGKTMLEEMFKSEGNNG